MSFGAFQSDAFQNDAFLVAAVSAPVAPPATAVASGGGGFTAVYDQDWSSFNKKKRKDEPVVREPEEQPKPKAPETKAKAKLNAGKVAKGLELERITPKPQVVETYDEDEDILELLMLAA